MRLNWRHGTTRADYGAVVRVPPILEPSTCVRVAGRATASAPAPARISRTGNSSGPWFCGERGSASGAKTHAALSRIPDGEGTRLDRHDLSCVDDDDAKRHVEKPIGWSGYRIMVARPQGRGSEISKRGPVTQKSCRCLFPGTTAILFVPREAE